MSWLVRQVNLALAFVGVGLEFWCLRALKVGPQPCKEEIGFYLCLLSRVSPTNSETPPDLIYLADSSGS